MEIQDGGLSDVHLRFKPHTSERAMDKLFLEFDAQIGTAVHHSNGPRI
jgi:hypothetical protein